MNNNISNYTSHEKIVTKIIGQRDVTVDGRSLTVYQLKGVNDEGIEDDYCLEVGTNAKENTSDGHARTYVAIKFDDYFSVQISESNNILFIKGTGQYEAHMIVESLKRVSGVLTAIMKDNEVDDSMIDDEIFKLAEGAGKTRTTKKDRVVELDEDTILLEISHTREETDDVIKAISAIVKDCSIKDLVIRVRQNNEY